MNAAKTARVSSMRGYQGGSNYFSTTRRFLYLQGSKPKLTENTKRRQVNSSLKPYKLGYYRWLSATNTSITKMTI